MLNETVLRDCLIELIEHCKEQSGITASLVREVAALREAAKEFGPAFDAALASKRTEHSTAQLEKITIQLFDDLIRKIKTGLRQ